MSLSNNEVKKVLYITMSNLGDAMMGLPAFDFLKREFPSAKRTVVAGPRTKCVFQDHPDVDDLIVYDKCGSLRSKIDLFFKLKKEKFDCVIDLRDTFYRWGLKAKYKNPGLIKYPPWAVHSSQRHLFKAVMAVRGEGIGEDEFLELNTRRNPSFIPQEDRNYIEKILKENGISVRDEFVLIVPGARSDLKKWNTKGYTQVAKEIREKYGLKVIIAGDKGDEALIGEIIRGSGEGTIDFSQKTDFAQLSSLILRSKLVICNDSGALHIASYLEKPVVGIYGPSDYKEYGPWSKRALAVRKSLLCAPCLKAHCKYDRQCIETIRPYDVMLAVRLIMEGDQAQVHEDKYRRILVVRTDRIGDVLISTPILKSLRDHYPTSYIAMMVAPATKDLIEGNPYLDRVIVFDKDKKDRGLFSTVSFSRKLKKEDFDIVVILHPTVRVHLVCFLAGIKERIGYDRKAPYFLTKAIAHKKQEGQKHEVEYNFDLLKPLGIAETVWELYMPIRESSEAFVKELLHQVGIGAQDRIVAVNPAASCLSKLWPLKKFAEVIDGLINIFNVKVVIVTDDAHRGLAQELLSLTKTMSVDLSGRCDLSQLASLFKRCVLVISNDSGPVHLCVAVGTPVVAIFGRNQPGLSPMRWGPIGPSNVILHKKTDCAPCLAHACTRHFKCLEAISAEEVLENASRLLKR